MTEYLEDKIEIYVAGCLHTKDAKELKEQITSQFPYTRVRAAPDLGIKHGEESYETLGNLADIVIFDGCVHGPCKAVRQYEQEGGLVLHFYPTQCGVSRLDTERPHPSPSYASEIEKLKSLIRTVQRYKLKIREATELAVRK